MLRRGHQRKLVLAVNSTLVIGSVGLLLWTVFSPIDIPNLNAVGNALVVGNDSPATLNPADAVDDQQWNQRLAERRLQGWAVAGPITEANSPPPNVESAPTSTGPLAGVQLTGTIIEPGKSFAMVVDRHGAVDLKPVGGTLQLDPVGIRIESIASRSIVVSYQGKTQEMMVANSPVAVDSPPAMAAGAPAREQPDDRPIGNATAPPADGSELEATTALEVELDRLNGSPMDQASDSDAPGVDN